MEEKITMAKKLLVFLAALAPLSSMASSTKVPNHLLDGRLYAHFEREVVRATESCGSALNPKVREVQLMVTGRQLRIDSVEIQFEDGDTQLLDVRGDYARNSSSPWIRIYGNEPRCIRVLVVSGQSMGKIMPSIWGRFTLRGR